MTYIPRLADRTLAAMWAELPAISLVGPRACGKTTTAARLTRTIVHLDQPGVAQAFRDDPDAALRAVGEPVLLDEWQHVPEVLGAVKRAVDAGTGGGRFLLTGSVSAPLQAGLWPGTGRVTEFELAPMVIRELRGLTQAPSIIDRLAAGDPSLLAVPPAQAPDVLDYLAMAVTSGFPEVQGMSRDARALWLRGYLAQLARRDSQLAPLGVDPTRLERYLEALGLHSATVVTDQRINAIAGISQPTNVSYGRLLRSLYVLVDVPAWTSRAVQRLVRSPKHLLVDAGLVAALAQEDETTITLDPAAKGRVIETFVTAQLRAEIPFARTHPRLSHLRDANGRREVDVILEYPGQRIVGAEVKSSSTVTISDTRHLAWLRDQIGERFIIGVVFHTGPVTRQLSERIYAAPISACWTDPDQWTTRQVSHARVEGGA